MRYLSLVEILELHERIISTTGDAGVFEIWEHPNLLSVNLT